MSNNVIFIGKVSRWLCNNLPIIRRYTYFFFFFNFFINKFYHVTYCNKKKNHMERTDFFIKGRLPWLIFEKLAKAIARISYWPFYRTSFRKARQITARNRERICAGHYCAPIYGYPKKNTDDVAAAISSINGTGAGKVNKGRPENTQCARNKLRLAAFTKSRAALRGRHENGASSRAFSPEPTSHSSRGRE